MTDIFMVFAHESGCITRRCRYTISHSSDQTVRLKKDVGLLLDGLRTNIPSIEVLIERLGLFECSFHALHI
jgi:hypothetical protein